MFPRVCGVRHLNDFELEISFSDGTVASLDFRKRIVGRGGVFESLENVDFFAQVVVDREAGTLVWPNGVDFCPDVLYAEATRQQLGNPVRPEYHFPKTQTQERNSHGDYPRTGS